jgi:hypothetical protein
MPRYNDSEFYPNCYDEDDRDDYLEDDEYIQDTEEMNFSRDEEPTND